MGYIFDEDELKLEDVYKDRKPFRKLTGMTVERIDGRALSIVMSIKNKTAENISVETRIPVETIEGYLNGRILLCDLITLQKLSKSLGCSPVDIILVKGEYSRVFRDVPDIYPEKTKDLYDNATLPDYKSGKKYKIKHKNSHSFKVYSFEKKQKGNNVNHYLFRNVDGGYIEAINERDILLGEVEIENV